MQKDIETSIISSIKTIEDFSDLILQGISVESFIIYRELFEFISKYYHKYNKLPSRMVIKAEFPDFIFSSENGDERKYLVDKLIQSECKRKAINILNKGSDLLLQDTYSGIDFIVSKLSSIRKPYSYSKSYTDKDAMSRLDSLIDRKDKISKGITIGLRTGFSIFDDKLIGWFPGNLISLIGRLGMGKSWLSLYISCSAYLDNKRVIYLSPEMTVQEVELRWDTLMSHFYNYQFSNEELSLGKTNAKEYKKWLLEAAKRSDWLTMDSCYGKPFTISAIESIIEDFFPDLLCVDGFLELRSEGNKLDKGWEVMLDIAYGLKAIAQNKKIVVLTTVQASRAAAGNMPELHQVYGGDAISQASDIVLTLTEDEKKPFVRYISIPKRRSGKTYNKKFEINFDVDHGKIGV